MGGANFFCIMSEGAYLRDCYCSLQMSQSKFKITLLSFSTFTGVFKNAYRLVLKKEKFSYFAKIIAF